MLPLHIIKLYPIVLCMRIYAKVQQETNRKICWYFQALILVPVLIIALSPSRRWASFSSKLYYIGLYFIVHTRIAWLQATFKVLVPNQHRLSGPINKPESGWLLFVCYRYNNTTTHRSPYLLKSSSGFIVENSYGLISYNVTYVLKSRCMCNLQIFKDKRNINHIWINIY